MGECGCGQEDISLVFPGPDGSKYGVEIYTGCHYCSTPAAVGLYRLDSGAEDEYGLFSHADEVEWTEHTPGVKWHGIQVITPEALVESMKQNMDEFLPSRFGTSDLFRTLQDAVWVTQGGKFNE